MSPLLELAAIDAEEHQLADVGIGPELEGQRAELAVVVGRDFDLCFGVRVDADGGRHIERGRQVINDRIDERLHAALLEGRAARAPGTNSILQVRRRMAAFRTSGVTGLFSMTSSAILSSLLDTASISSARAALAASFRSAGISVTWYLRPSSSFGS